MPQYTRLPSDEGGSLMPLDPPMYADVGMEQFEIEDDAPGPRELLLFRMKLATKKFTYGLRSLVVVPLQRLMDPVREGYNYVDMLYERFILKMGNPLVVKRLLYVGFVLAIVFYITHALAFKQNGVSGTTGGTFYSGHFYDVDILGQNFAKYISPSNMEENLAYLSQEPRLAGTGQDLVSARYVHDWFKLNGLHHCDIQEVLVHINYPVPHQSSLKIGDWQATLYEPGNGTDPVLPYWAFVPNGMASDGEIAAGMVYVGQGSPDDFDAVAAKQVLLQDRVVVASMGGIPELEKVVLAHKFGAKAMVLISPAGGDEYDPEVRDRIILRPNVGRVRQLFGSVLSPDWSNAKRDEPRGFVPRVLWDKLPVTPKIPVLPISHADGQILLEKVKANGKNNVDFGNHLVSGDGSVEVKLTVATDSRPVQKAWNVVGSIPGREVTGQAIIVGAGRDSVGPDTTGLASSTTVLLELVRALTQLKRQKGWSPARLIYFMLWDATNYNLAGSTEWVEFQREELKQQGYVYVDINDVVTGGNLEVKGHPALHLAIFDGLKRGTGASGKLFYDEFRDNHDGTADLSYAMNEEKNYLPFINAANIPAMELRFVADKEDGVRGTCANNWNAFVDHHIDPGMKNHFHAVYATGLIMLQLLELPFIPYDLQMWAAKLTHYRRQLELFIDRYIAAHPELITPVIHYAALDQGIGKLNEAGVGLRRNIKAWTESMARFDHIEAPALRMFRLRLNELIMDYNPRFVIDIKGESGRTSTYRNVLFGPSLYAPNSEPSLGSSDNGDNAFPVIRDYVYEKDWGRVQLEINRLGAFLTNAATG